MSRFDSCLSETLRWEGGWSDDPHDPGGPTMRGIIQRVYDGYRDARGQPRRTVREIDEAEVRDIYWHNYWLPSRAGELPAGLDLAVFDFAVNSGPPRAVRHLQRAVGTKDDGHIGAATLAAVNAVAPAEIISRLMESRRSFLRQIPHFWRFGKGWLRRCDGVEAAALVMCHALDVPRPVAEPIADADKQSAEQGRATAEPGKSGITETAGLGAAGGTAQMGIDAASAAAAVKGKGGGALDLLLELAQRMTFWLALGTALAGAYVLLKRLQQKRLA